jgi:biopolymer transport protein ExbB
MNGKARLLLIALTLMVSLIMFGQFALGQEGKAPAAAPAAAPADAPAAGGEGGGEKKEAGGSLLSQVGKAGPIEWLLICLSMTGMSLFIEGLVSIRRVKIIPMDVLEEIEGLFEEENFEDALALCEEEDCSLTRVIGSGLRRMEYGHGVMMGAVDEQVADELARYGYKIGWLSLLAQTGPLLGLLGTVTGMIGSFRVMVSKSNLTPQDLADGISEALVCTATGLIVCIPMVGAFFMLKNRVTYCVREVQVITYELFERFRK